MKFRETMAAKKAEAGLASVGIKPASTKAGPRKGSPKLSLEGDRAESEFMKFLREDRTYYLKIGPFKSKQEMAQFLLKVMGVE